MKHIIEWLLRIEKMAYVFYAQSATQFDDAEITTFLENAAQDEAHHYRTMSKALETVNNHPDLISAIALDQELVSGVEACFKRNQLKLDDRALDTESLIDCIIETELSEWNHVFTYVVNSLKEKSSEFKEAAVRIQQHLRHMEQFLFSHPYGAKKITPLTKLKPVWKEKILVVDDNPEILTLLEAILNRDGIVEVAENGKIALEKAQKTYYHLIISDVDMPVMNGLEFYHQASAEFPGIQQRMVFMTGDPSPERINFFNRYKLKYLTKPVSIQQIRDVSLESMNKISIAS